MLEMPELDKLFCMSAKKYHLKKLLLKAVAQTESGFNERAYRYEPGFFQRYMRTKPEWKDRDPSKVSASYGLMQLMYTTAYGLGYRDAVGEEEGEGLYNPAVNIALGAKLLRQLLDRVPLRPGSASWDIEVALAWYNGGTTGNPGPDGKLRNQRYVDKVLRAWAALALAEKECGDD